MPTLSPQTTPYYGGGQVVNPANVLNLVNAPSTVLSENLLGTIAIDYVDGSAYIITQKSGGVDTWDAIGGNAALNELTGDTGTATAAAGAIKLAGTANQITTAAASHTVTFTIPSVFIAPGSIASTTTITSGTGITSTTGNIVASAGNISTTLGSITSATTLTATSGAITATNGNFVALTAGTGLLLAPASTAGTTTATLNGRVGQVTITTPSIAGGAQFTMTISNTSISGSSTQVGYWLTGGTNGSALSIQSYTNTANQSVVVINNGTGATTNTASLVLNFLVLN